MYTFGIYFQEDGRHYNVGKNDVLVRRATVDTLKFWNARYPSIIYDSKFLKELATDVFGIECLSRSNVFGKRAWNSTSKHLALDELKLKFVEGNRNDN